jgi:hypothetical protein
MWNALGHGIPIGIWNLEFGIWKINEDTFCNEDQNKSENKFL